MPSKIVKNEYSPYGDVGNEYEKDSDCSEDEEIDNIHEDIPDNEDYFFEDVEENELNLAIIEEDIDEIKEAIKNNVKGDGKTLFYAIKTTNNDIIDLIMQYDTPVVSSVLAESIRYVNDSKILDKLIIYLKDKDRLNLKKRSMYTDFSIEDSVITEGREYFNRAFNTSSKEKQEKKKIIFSLLFRNCLKTEVEELKNKLKKLRIKTINGKDINDILSQDELCELIQNEFDIQIDKYDDFNLEIIKPAIINTKNDNDDDDDDDDELN
jgi:hypothetical protein